MEKHIEHGHLLPSDHTHLLFEFHKQYISTTVIQRPKITMRTTLVKYDISTCYFKYIKKWLDLVHYILPKMSLWFRGYIDNFDFKKFEILFFLS